MKLLAFHEVFGWGIEECRKNWIIGILFVPVLFVFAVFIQIISFLHDEEK